MNRNASKELVTIEVKVPKSLLGELDEIASTAYPSREEFVREAIRRFLEHLTITQKKAEKKHKA